MLYLEHLRDEVDGEGTEVGGDVVLTRLYLLKQHRDIAIIKWQSATQQSIEDHSTRPHIHLRPWVCVCEGVLRGGGGVCVGTPTI